MHLVIFLVKCQERDYKRTVRLGVFSAKIFFNFFLSLPHSFGLIIKVTSFFRITFFPLSFFEISWGKWRFSQTEDCLT